MRAGRADRRDAALRWSGDVVWTLDQDEALAYYTQVLGFEVVDDLDLGFARWLAVCPAGQPAARIVLTDPGAVMTPEDAGLVEELLRRHRGPGPQLHTDDARAAYDVLVGRGARVAQPLSSSAYGVDFELLDPSGNRIRVVETRPDRTRLPRPGV